MPLLLILRDGKVIGGWKPGDSDIQIADVSTFKLKENTLSGVLQDREIAMPLGDDYRFQPDINIDQPAKVGGKFTAPGVNNAGHIFWAHDRLFLDHAGHWPRW